MQHEIPKKKFKKKTVETDETEWIEWFILK